MNYFLLFVLLLVISENPLSSSTPELFYRSCSNPFKCGKIVADFPFWGGYQRPRECGHPGFELHCEKDTAFIKIVGVRYRVLEIHPQPKKLRIAREDYEGGRLCPQKIQNTALDTTLFNGSPDNIYFTLLYGCPDFLPPLPSLKNFSCSNGFKLTYAFILPGVSGNLLCSASATVLVQGVSGKLFSTIEQALIDGFEIEWKVDDKACQNCLDSKGKCGFDLNNQTVCYCLGASTAVPVCRSVPDNIPAIISLPAPPPAANNPDLWYSNCSQTFKCGSIENVCYPSWGVNRADYRGQPGFELDCQDDVPKIMMLQNTFRVLGVNPEQQILKVARDDYWEDICPAEFINTTIDSIHFSYVSSGLQNLTLYYD